MADAALTKGYAMTYAEESYSGTMGSVESGGAIQRLDQLDQAMERLDKNIGGLIERIDPIVRPESPEVSRAETLNAIREPRSRVHTRIEDTIRMLDKFSDLLSQTTLRVDL